MWKVENSDIKVGSTLTIAPYVVKDKVIIGSSGAELGVRGYLTAYDVKISDILLVECHAKRYQPSGSDATRWLKWHVTFDLTRFALLQTGPGSSADAPPDSEVAI